MPSRSRQHPSPLRRAPWARVRAGLRRNRAFSLLEIVIVLIVLGTLAAIALPRLGGVSNMGHASELRDALRQLRTQILIYRAQHRGVAPGYPDGNTLAEPTFEAFAAQMTGYTSPNGRLAASRTALARFGPYLTRMPVNPLKENAMIRFIGPDEQLRAAPGGPEGWVYQPSTGMIAANSDGADADRVAFFDY
ncbi:MAG: type II secretion system protein [Planctomycetota bacterium]|nr:type II secretion system protein [Planctomycetota bacterium]